MAYKKQTFIDKKTTLKAEHLNHIEEGIVGNEKKILKVQEHTNNLSSAVENTLYVYQKVRGDVIDIPENLHFSKSALLRSLETEAYEGDRILTSTGSYVDIDGDIVSIPESITDLPNYGYGAGAGYNNTVDFESGKYTQRCIVFEPMNTGNHYYTFFQGLTFDFPISRYDEYVKAIETVKCSHSELTFSYYNVQWLDDEGGATEKEEATIADGMLRVKLNGNDPTEEELQEFIDRERANNHPVTICYGLFDPIVTSIPKVDIELPVDPCSGVDFDGAVGEIYVFVPKPFVDSSFVESKCANALRGTMSGALVSADDVSPMEHELDVKVRSKNLFKTTNYEKGSLSNGAVSSLQKFAITSDYIFLPKGNYIISYIKGAVGVDGAHLRYIAVYDKDKNYIASESLWSARVNNYKFTLDGDRYVRIDLEKSAPDGGVGSGSYPIENYDTFLTDNKVMLELGTTATAYTPYVDVEGVNVTVTDGEISQTATADAEGNVKLMSLAPNMTLVGENGTVIDCTYNRDINKAFEKITQAMVSLGANI